jgi:hypothetical protein
MSAIDEHFERLLNEHCTDLPECPECDAPSLDVSEGRNGKGWWYEAECTNPDCDYASSAFDSWESDD